MRLTYFGIFLASGTLCRAWRATFSDATQCQDVTVQWAGIGGEKLGPPFVVRLAAFGLAPLTIDVPTSAWSDAAQSGSYSFNIPWPAETKFVAAMDDGYGSGTGGITGIQSVKASSNSSCVTTAITQPEHVFDVYGTYIQCSVVSMNWTEPATSSTRVTGLVPNGVAFRLDPPVANSRSTTWDLNIPGGTAFVLMYVAPSGPGLASQLLVSQANGASNACLSSGAYPSATASQTGVAQATGTLRPSSSVTPTPVTTGSNAPKLGPIIGATLGAVAFLCALLGLVFCLYRRKHRFARVRPQSPSSGKEINLESNTSCLDDAPVHYHNLPEGAVILPFELPRSASTRETQSSANRKVPFLPHTRSTTRRMSHETLTSEPSHGTPPTSSARRDGSEAEDGEPVYIQHADGGAVPTQPRAREVIELPPTYDQLPRPLPRSGQVEGGVRVQGRAELRRKVGERE